MCIYMYTGKAQSRAETRSRQNQQLESTRYKSRKGTHARRNKRNGTTIDLTHTHTHTLSLSIYICTQLDRRIQLDVQLWKIRAGRVGSTPLTLCACACECVRVLPIHTHIQESRRNESEIRLDREVNNLRTHVEQTKNDIIKYSMGFLVSISAVGLGLIRLLI